MFVGVRKKAYFPYVCAFLCAIILTPQTLVFAEEIDWQKLFDDGLDSISGFSRTAINNTDIDDSYKGKIDHAIDSGIPVAKQGISFWLALHHFIVDMIFSNSPIPISAGVVTIIGLVIIGFAVFHFLRKLFKVIVYVGLFAIAVILFIVVFGTNFNFGSIY